jgi:hypothetical protein
MAYVTSDRFRKKLAEQRITVVTWRDVARALSKPGPRARAEG